MGRGGIQLTITAKLEGEVHQAVGRARTLDLRCLEAQHNLSKVLRQVEEGQAVYITRRKQVVAGMGPPAPEGPVAFPDFGRRARRTWGDKWTGASSQELLEASRAER